MGKDLWRHPVPATPNNDEAAKRILFFANFKNNLVCRERNKGGGGLSLWPLYRGRPSDL